MLDASSSGMTDRIDAQEIAEKPTRGRKARRKPAKNSGSAPKRVALPETSPAVSMEAPAVMAAAGFMTPFAVAAEATMFWRRARGLSMCWMGALSRCRTPQDLIETNAHYGEKALALGYSETFRVLERGALMGRQAAAPGSLALRDCE